MRRILLASVVALAVVGCNFRHRIKEKHHVKVYHLKDKRWCYHDTKTNKWYWLEKLADIDFADVPEADYFHSSSLPRSFPSGYGWVGARAANVPGKDNIDEENPENVEEDMAVNEEGDPAVDSDADGGASEADGGDSGGDSGGGDGGGGDGGGDGGE